jgi:hypothetical protein
VGIKPRKPYKNKLATYKSHTIDQTTAQTSKRETQRQEKGEQKEKTKSPITMCECSPKKSSGTGSDPVSGERLPK